MNRRGPAATFLTGALFVLSYALGTPGYDVPGLPLVCLAPFLALASSARSERHAAWRGWIAGTAASIPLYYWIAYTVGVQGKLGWALGGLAAFLVSAYVGAYFSVAAAVARRLESRFGENGLWLFPAAWTAVEMARSYLFSGFPWMLLVYSVTGSATLRQRRTLRRSRTPPSSSPSRAYPSTRGTMSALPLERGDPADPRGRGAPVPRPVWSDPSGEPGGSRGTVSRGSGGHRTSAGSTMRERGPREPGGHARDLQRADAAGDGRGCASVVVWPETAAPFIYGWNGALSRGLEAIAGSGGVPTSSGPLFDPAEGGKFSQQRLPDGRARGSFREVRQRHLVPFGDTFPCGGSSSS